MAQTNSIISEILFSALPILEPWLRGVVADEVQKALEENQAKKRPPKTYSRQEVAKMAHISLPTLWAKMKEGKISPLPNSGRRVIFSEAEVKRFLGED